MPAAKKPASKSQSTGLKKFLGQEAKMYEPTKKGSGKPKYKNVVKEGRLNTKQAEKLDRLAGKKLSKSEAQARTRNSKNIAKEIAKEEKIRTGVNTAKPSTKKVPVKPRGGAGMRGGLGSFGTGGGMRGSVNK